MAEGKGSRDKEEQTSPLPNHMGVTASSRVRAYGGKTRPTEEWLTPHLKNKQTKNPKQNKPQVLGNVFLQGPPGGRARAAGTRGTRARGRETSSAGCEAAARGALSSAEARRNGLGEKLLSALPPCQRKGDASPSPSPVPVPVPVPRRWGCSTRGPAGAGRGSAREPRMGRYLPLHLQLLPSLAPPAPGSDTPGPTRQESARGTCGQSCPRPRAKFAAGPAVAAGRGAATSRRRRDRGGPGTGRGGTRAGLGWARARAGGGERRPRRHCPSPRAGPSPRPGLCPRGASGPDAGLTRDAPGRFQAALPMSAGKRGEPSQ